MPKLSKESKHVEVLVAYTMPEMWRQVQRTPHIAVQANNSADANYIAFLRTGLKDEKGKRLSGTITHIAKVKENRSDVPLSEYYNGEKNPEIAKVCEEKGWKDRYEVQKEYHLEKIEELPKPIPHRKGDRARSQVKFYTTLEELGKARVLSDIKTISQLEREEKNNRKIGDGSEF